MTPDQIEAERVRFEAAVTARIGISSFARYHAGNYVIDWIAERWQGWLDRAEEQYAERKGHDATREN